MLKGSSITLRPVFEADIDQLYAHHLDLANRGDYLPRDIVSQVEYKKKYQETGFWGKDSGTLLIVNREDKVIGSIVFFKSVDYMDEYEIGYQIFRPEDRGKGAATEAVNLMVRYLFITKQMNRIRLVTHTDNAASRRVAEKSGFQHEGTARKAVFFGGKHHDVEIYGILRDEVPLDQ